MDVDPAALEALVERMDADTTEERDGDLDDFFCAAWPTKDAQDN